MSNAATVSSIESALSDTDQKWTGGWVLSAFCATAPAVPLVALVTTTAVYLAPSGAGWLDSSINAGLFVALLAWLVFAAIFWYFGLGRADRANPREYGEVQERFNVLDAQFVALARPSPAAVAERQIHREAYEQAKTIRAVLQKAFALPIPSGIGWVRATMYVNLWTLIHRFEEALIQLQPAETVCAGARYDELRLLNSEIANQSDLLNDLRRGVRALCNVAADYLTLAVAQAGISVGSGQTTVAASTGAAFTQPSSETCVDEDIARSMLREVRHEINEFRDNRRDGLVRARNGLVKTLIITGLATYVLLILVVIRHPSPTAVAAGAVFYVVGAIAGLFNRLFLDLNSDTAIEDYGLAVIRLVVIPIISGIAALGGVLVTAQLPLLPTNANGAIVISPPSSPSQGPAATQRALVPTSTQTTAHTPATAAFTLSATTPVTVTIGTSSSAPTLAEIYSLDGNRFGIVTAAIFGLTPNLLIGRLTQSEQYKAQLQSTSAQTAKRA